MDNKNKKDMSVDDLVKQLKLVLDINDEDEGKPSKTPEEEIIQVTEPETEETAEPMTAEKAETISDKVKLLDQFFEEEENKKNKKKNKVKLRDKKKKKAKQDDDLVIKTFDNVREESDEDMTEAQLTSFADEIGDMFSDPDENKKDEVKPSAPVEDETETDAAIAATVAATFTASKTAEKAEEKEEHLPKNTDGESDAPDFKSEYITSDDDVKIADDLNIEDDDIKIKDDDVKIAGEKVKAAEETVNDADEDEYISPFVKNALGYNPADEEDLNPQGSYVADESAVPTVVIPDKQIKKEEKSVNSEIEDFNVFFEDLHPENTDGYTVSEEAIMDAFGERKEKPEKNPVKSKADLSISDYEEENDAEEGQAAPVPAYDEFTSYDQRKTFLETYKKKYLSLKLSMIFSAIFAALVFVYECLSFAGASFPQFCSPEQNPSVFILIDLQLFAICAIFGVQYVLSGIKGIFSGKASIASLGALSVVITFIYGILSAITAKPAAHPVMTASALCLTRFAFPSSLVSATGLNSISQSSGTAPRADMSRTGMSFSRIGRSFASCSCAIRS